MEKKTYGSYKLGDFPSGSDHSKNLKDTYICPSLNFTYRYN